MSAPMPASQLGLAKAVVDRRERRRVSMHGFAMREDGTTIEILVLDLSYEGCGIEVPAPLEIGEWIKLSVLRRGAIDAQVRWASEGKAGLVFKAEDEKSVSRKPRKNERISLSAEVTTRRLGNLKFRVRALDVSQDGCKVELVELPRVGEHMFVKFTGLEALEAQVCWVDGHVAGLSFEKPIHPAVFEMLLENLKN